MNTVRGDSIYLTVLIVVLVTLGLITVSDLLSAFRTSVSQYLFYKQKVSTNSISSVVSKLPDGWNTVINDDSRCYTIYIEYQGKFDGDIKEYLVSKNYVNDTDPNKIIDLNTYEINSPHVVDLGPQGMGNKNTIYIKDNSNNIFLIEIHYILNEYEELKSCGDLYPVVQHIVKSLL